MIVESIGGDQMIKGGYILALVVGLACYGCATGINVTKVPEDAVSVTGVPWNLSMTQFTVSITRQVTKCGETMEGSVQTTITPIRVPDAQQRYALESNGWFATSDITSTLAADGTSTGLNASSADQTATVISNTLGTIAQVAIIAAAGAPPNPITKKVEVCDKKVVDALADMNPPGKPKLKEQVDSDTNELTLATAHVTALTAQAQVDKSFKSELAKAIGAQTKAQDRLNEDQKRLTKDLKVTSDTQVVSWPLKAEQFVTEKPFSLDFKTFGDWAPHGDGAARVQFDVYMKLYAQDPKTGSWSSPNTLPTGDVSVGVPVRLARMGRLLVCAKNKCPDILNADWAQADGQKSADQPVLQLGPIYNVPVSGGTFKSEGAVIALDANGLPTSIQITEKVAAAAGATSALKDAASQAAALPGQIAAAKLSATQAQTAQINADAALALAPLQSQTGQANAQSALATALANAASAGQTAPLVAQAALNTATANQLTTLATLVAAQANAQDLDQTSALAAQTTLLNAQAALLNAKAALAKAQAAQ